MLFYTMPKVTFFTRASILYCRVTINNQSAEFSLKERVAPGNWNQAQQFFLARTKRQTEYVNTLLDTVRYKLKTNALLIEDCTPRALINSIAGKPAIARKEVKLAYLAEQYIRSVLQVLSPGTIRTYYGRLKNLSMYEADCGKRFSVGDLSLDSHPFNSPEAERFKEWFKSKKGTGNVTSASRNVEFFRSAMQYGIKVGVIERHDLAFFEPERDALKLPVALTHEEATRLITHSFASKMLEQIRDLYCFQMSTGLSFADIWSDWKIKETDNGRVLHGRRSKNNQAFFVPADNLAFAILERYNYNLPKYENQVYNRVLKEVAAVVGIDKHLTTHTGRKTFATFMRADGWSIPSIADMLGHKSIRTTETYYFAESTDRVEIEFAKRYRKA